MPKKLFEGIKVADFTGIFTGPLTTKYLSDYGAEVLKIEERARAEVLRSTPPFKDNIPGVNRGGSFNQYMTGSPFH